MLRYLEVIFPIILYSEDLGNLISFVICAESLILGQNGVYKEFQK